MKKKNSLITNFIALSVIPFVSFGVLVLLIVSFAVYASIKEEAQNGLESLVYSVSQMYEAVYEGDYTFEDGKFRKGEKILSDDFSIVDAVKEASGVDITVFYKDIRMATSIRNPDGTRAVGTQAEREVIRAVLEDGRDYFSDRISVNGYIYFGYYTPLRNSDGEVAGMVFAGKTREHILRSIRSVIKKIAGAAVLMMLMVGFFSGLYAKRIVYVLNRTKEFLKAISRGELNREADPCLLNRNDEIGEMGKFAVILQKSITELVGTDPLTGLYNRRSGGQALENMHLSCQKNGGTFVLAIGDIDNFKNVNDTFGHPCGDAVLKQLAEIFKQHMKKKGFIFRWGGEEFLFLYEKADKEKARSYLEELRRQIETEQMIYQENSLQVTMTFGAKEYEKDMGTSAIIQKADENLYYGKNQGKNQVIL